MSLSPENLARTGHTLETCESINYEYEANYPRTQLSTYKNFGITQYSYVPHLEGNLRNICILSEIGLYLVAGNQQNDAGGLIQDGLDF